MKIVQNWAFTRSLADDSGQALPWMVLLCVVFLSFGGITVDLGHLFVSKRQLQASTDAAAMAGAYAMSLTGATASTVQTAVSAYSTASGGNNANSNFSSVTITPTLKCLTTVSNWGVSCSLSPTGNNAIQVTQSATVNTWFIRAVAMFGVSAAQTVNIQAKATAAMRGASNQQYNVAIVIDTTASMGQNDTDASCNNKRITCALNGVQVLLQSLSPCTQSSTSTSCTAFDQVSLFTFPNIQANQASNDTTCPTSNPTIPYYSTPTAGATWSAPTGTAATYQVTGYMSDYSATNQANGGLSTSSALSIATGASGHSNCTGLQTPGGDGTYYAAAIYAAQSSLMAAQAANPGSKNALIILSDGAANTSKMTSGKHNGNTYPSLDDQCQQGITAAQYANGQGTTVYTVAYGASTSGGGSQCTTDPSLSPCSALQQMASSSATFYSDATASQNSGQCISSANPNLTLNQIFQHIAPTLTVARLIPDSTT